MTCDRVGAHDDMIYQLLLAIVYVVNDCPSQKWVWQCSVTKRMVNLPDSPR